VGPNLGAIALGETKNTLIGNFVRSLTLPLGVAVATVGWGTTGVVLTLLCGEILGYCSTLVMFSILCELSFPISTRSFAIAFALVGCSFCLSSVEFVGNYVLREIAFAVVISGISAFVVFSSSSFPLLAKQTKVAADLDVEDRATGLG
jgi:hypothetical protein